MITPSVAAVLLFITSTAAVQSGEGVFFGDLPSCDRRVHVITPDGQTILVWPDRNYPPIGEDLRGDFQTIGETIIYRADGSAVQVRVEEAGLTGRQVMYRERRCDVEKTRAYFRR
jgi:hypothetical protein